ncbi:hypothetical protein [Halioxenophilus sp. WMMB6]|uniref:hypothetical protein n=1 Tax=Halioxenophilus sp. WMMB6 TaxID=3073815 RepID=UPI00295F3F8E|nr:hypothetical protein [Halioxenophilus sp. WMMB6]
MLKKSIVPLLIAGALSTSVTVGAEPAVDAINAKASLIVGSDEVSLVDVNLTLPVTHAIGAQVDIASGNHELGNVSAVSGHLFWRDPSSALLGVIASWHSFELIDNRRIALQGEKFLNDITLRAIAGYESSKAEEAGHSDTIEDAYGKFKATWYPQNNLALYTKLNQHHERTGGGIGAEWQAGYSANIGYSLFAELDHTEGEGNRGLVGIRFYFDGGKSLIQRHRSADPDSGNDFWNNNTSPMCDGSAASRAFYPGICG